MFLHGVAPYDEHDSWFKGLDIEARWQDQGQYLVLRLNFAQLNAGCTTFAEFERQLLAAVSAFGRAHALKVPSSPRNFWALFEALLKQLPRRSLVLLVDDYDVPVLSHMGQPDELSAGKTLLRGLFSSIKSNLGKFRCGFCTGLTRYQDLELGTAANSFTDLTHDPKFAACCGFTTEELKQYFADHMRAAAAVQHDCAPAAVSPEQVEQLLDAMAQWYGGYSFDGAPPKLCAPGSVLRFLAAPQARLQGYWDAWGLPQLITQALARNEQLRTQLSAGEVVVKSKDFLRAALINPTAHPYSLLFQTGYLTLSQPFTLDGTEHLVCPNQETRLAPDRLLAQL